MRIVSSLRRLLLALLGVLLVAVLAAAVTFGYQGYRLYQKADAVTPIHTLYAAISARPGAMTS